MSIHNIGFYGFDEALLMSTTVYVEIRKISILSVEKSASSAAEIHS